MNLKKIIVILAIVVSLAAFCGCGAKPAEGFDFYGGNWQVGAIVYDDFLLDIHDDTTLESLYSVIYLNFEEDGKFNHYNFRYYEGKYTKSDDADSSENTLLLKTTKTYEFVKVEEELFRKEMSAENNTLYKVTPLDENTIIMTELDPATGEALPDSTPYIFVRQNTESAYIAENKSSF